MPNLKQLRRRIQGIRNTQQLTRAMKLVAASKLRKAQTAVETLRPYNQGVETLMNQMAPLASPGHPLLKQTESKKIWLLALTSDKGLCGAFNSNVGKAVELFLKNKKHEYDSIDIIVAGKKGQAWLQRRSIPCFRFIPGLQGQDCRELQDLVKESTLAFHNGTMDGLVVVYNEFKSALAQKIRFRTLLPLEIKQEEGKNEFILEPGPDEIMERLAPLYLETQVRGIYLESQASEMGARMTAMDAASNNARDLIERLTLVANKARQEAITKELIDIVGGAEALG